MSSNTTFNAAEEIDLNKVTDINHPNRTKAGLKTKPPVPLNFEFNNLNEKAYQDIGLNPPGHLGYFERKFLLMVDLDKGPIERTVMTMTRLKAPDYLNQGDKPRPERKEYLVYSERWDGKNHIGLALNPVHHTMGVYDKQFTRPHFNQKGEADYNELDPAAKQTIYTIPFSKKTVDDIISKSANSDKYNIIFTVKWSPEDSQLGPATGSRCQWPYDDFVSDWDILYLKHTRPTAQAWDEYERLKGKTSKNLKFEPT